MMRYLFYIWSVFLFTTSCSKTNPQCTIPAIVPFQPYSFPVWHPNSQIIGFNYTPLAGISEGGQSPCLWYNYHAKSDSTGFYIKNINGSGFSRATNFKLFAPAWSPDGNWIAFSLGSNIYKMRFSGNGFDTANLIQLTTSGGNFHPSWTANSDTIFYDSNAGTNGQGYYVWKMSSDGNQRQGFPGTGREPFVSSDKKIYYFGINYDIFSMDSDGMNVSQLSSFTNQNMRTELVVINQKLYFQESNKLYSLGNNILKQIILPSVNYSLNSLNEIVYSKMEYSITNYNKQIGTLWLINSDGTNNRQLTFNNF